MDTLDYTIHWGFLTCHPLDSLTAVYTTSAVIDSQSVDGIYLTNDGGTTWSAMENAPFYGHRVHTVAFNSDGTYLYIGLTKDLSNPQGGLWRWDVSNISVAPPSTEIAFDLRIVPNPFNEITLIQFEIEQNAPIMVAVYNILGQRLEVLLNSRLRSGHYSVPWHASAWSSGPYLVRISTPYKHHCRTAFLAR
ncbi:T9SS type A sorting domain-containing protein [bacterium]|nr:T9SS type A sorting domain-containing protein [bacterium]